jgi:hypothetical protein
MKNPNEPCTVTIATIMLMPIPNAAIAKKASGAQHAGKKAAVNRWLRTNPTFSVRRARKTQPQHQSQNQRRGVIIRGE